MCMIAAIDMKRTGRNIARLRKDAGLSVRDMQNALGFANPQAIYKWQNGVTLPSIDNLVMLSMLLRTPMDNIIVVSGKNS